ncbi:DUF541 domain-containing protein [Candidatus Parcubacteria bacterium]|nr:MAG: DUF541 domain-containing protein [Candidatus Parcubacteria bacterium]
MDKQIKNYFGIGAIASMGILAISALIFAAIYYKSIEPSSYRSFSVQGEGKVTATPNVAQFSFSVTTEGGKDIGAIQNENSQKANQAIAFIKNNGVEDSDIKTVNYDLQPRYQYFSCPATEKNSSSRPCPPPEIVGYTVSQTIFVKVRDFDKISSLMSGIVQSGVNSISSLSFVIDDMTELESQARETAIEAAIIKAESISSSGNFKLGKILSINEGYAPIYGLYEKGFNMVSSDAAIAPEIEPGSQEVKVTVTLTYEIR